MNNSIPSESLIFNPTKVLILAVPILLYFLFIGYFSLNIPWIDDFYWYFEFLQNVNKHSNSFAETLTVFFTPYNGHLHTPQRLLYLLFVLLFDTIDIQFFILLGNLTFLLLFVLIIKPNVKRFSGVTHREMALGWFFFQPVSYYNFFECAFFNLPVLLFAYLSIVFFYKNKLIYSIFLAVICTTLNGNGFLIWIIGIIVAFDRGSWKQGLLYACFLMTFLSLMALQASNLLTSTEITASSLWESVQYYLQLLGRITYWTDESLPWISLAIGGFLVLVFTAHLKKFHADNKRLLLFMLFMLMSIGLIALKRKELVNGTAIIVDTYLMYPQLFLGCLIYTITLNNPAYLSRKMIVLFFAIVLSFTNYIIYTPKVAMHHNYQVANMLNYEEQEKWLLYPPIQGKVEYKMANAVTDYTIKMGQYDSPKFKLKKLTTTCQLKIDKNRAIVNSNLDGRILMRTLFVRLTDTENTHTYFPIESQSLSVLDWVRSRKNRKIATTLDINTLNDPIDAYTLKECAIVELVDK